MPRKNKSAKDPLKRTGQDFPEDCRHLNFFWCKNAKECFGCFYNPIKEEALQNEEGFEDEVKTEKENWFYGRDPRIQKVLLSLLDDIKNRRGLHKNGTPFRWRYSRKNKFDEEE